MFLCDLSAIPAELMPGINELKNDLTINVGGAVLKLFAKKGTHLEIDLREDSACITYSEKANFFRGLSLLAQNINSRRFHITQSPCFARTGVMFDCSRNAVLNIETLKFFLRKMSFMGMNSCMLYTEDTYEIKGRPFFGYLRGRYTCQELKELDNYADMFGIELIPCIQTLGHLERALHWPVCENLKDTSEILLLGQDETYQFIEEMIVAASAPFRSKRIHIGMDEAYSIGRGKYLDRHGYKTADKLMEEHLRRVCAIVKKHGLHAMMWSDMHFCNASKNGLPYETDCIFTPEILESAPDDVDLVYWDYYHENETHYDIMLKKHSEFGSKTIFAGGIWSWIGPATDYRKTIAATLPALCQCKKHNISEVFATAWGDDGAEANVLTILYGMQIFAEYSYTGHYDGNKTLERFKICVGAHGRHFLDLSLFNNLPGMTPLPEGTVNAAKIILYEDPLLPLYEEDLKNLPCSAHYKDVMNRFSAFEEKMPCFQGCSDFMQGLQRFCI